MANEEIKKSYVNPGFTSAFKRVKDILDDLKTKFMPVKQGNATDFRDNINKAIGTIPETDQKTGAITKDGSGMSGAVFAMGEAVEIVLESIGDTLNNFDKDAQATLDDKVKKAMEDATKDAKAATDAITGKVNNFLIVSTAKNGRPIDNKGNEIYQMTGGIWFKINSDEEISYGGTTNTSTTKTTEST